MIWRLAIGISVLVACNSDHQPAPTPPAGSAAAPTPPAGSAAAPAVARPEPDGFLFAGDHLNLEDSHQVTATAALADLSALAPDDRELARARLWVLRNTEWGWGVVSSERVNGQQFAIGDTGFIQTVAMLAKQNPKLTAWLQVSDDDAPLAMVAMIGGRVTVVDASKLSVDRMPVGIARNPAELHEVVAAMGEKLGGDFELSGGLRVEAPDPSPDVLRTAELWPGRALPEIEDTFYVTEAMDSEVLRLAKQHDSGMSQVVQRAYTSVRARVLKMSAAQLAPSRGDGKVGMFIVLPAWMHMEIQHRATELDVSMSHIVAMVLELAKAPAH